MPRNVQAHTKEKRKTLCITCEHELEPDHPGIQCVQGHHFCVECSRHIVNLFFSEPQNYIPLRCRVCHIELNPSVFERQLDEKETEFYVKNMLVLVWAKEILGPDECLVNCPSCNFAIIRDKNIGHILYCERPNCLKVSCLVCKKTTSRSNNNYANENELAEIIRHSICATMAEDKILFENALESGTKMSCPKCGLAGMKDDSCTHMTCPTCSQEWCYFCGKSNEECDKVPGGNNGIIDHNADWNINPNRCPMYFTQIHDIDERWPEDDFQCLVMFHRIRSIRLLREVVENLGENRIRELDNHFNLFSSSGFTLDEIRNADLTIICGREENYRRRNRHH